MSLGKLPALRRVTGGLVRAGLCCRFLEEILRGAIRPGDCDDIDVGVVSRLKAPGPGDSDHLADGLALMALTWLLLAEK